jgi:hypothetical protein
MVKISSIDQMGKDEVEKMVHIVFACVGDGMAAVHNVKRSEKFYRPFVRNESVLSRDW